jgi:hypothetical protein
MTSNDNWNVPPEARIGDKPIEAELREMMNRLARAIDGYLNPQPAPKKIGFVMLMFKFGSDGRCNYISNADRGDVVKMLKEQLAHFEGSPASPASRSDSDG